MNSTILAVLSELADLGAKSLTQCIQALQDGEVLGKVGITQTQAEEVHSWCADLVERMQGASVNIDSEHGFLWLSDEKSENFFQCCVDKSGELDKSGTGATWGICGEYNLSVWKYAGIVKLIEGELLNMLQQNPAFFDSFN